MKTPAAVFSLKNWVKSIKVVKIIKFEMSINPRQNLFLLHPRDNLICCLQLTPQNQNVWNQIWFVPQKLLVLCFLLK